MKPSYLFVICLAFAAIIFSCVLFVTDRQVGLPDVQPVNSVDADLVNKRDHQETINFSIDDGSVVAAKSSVADDSELDSANDDVKNPYGETPLVKPNATAQTEALVAIVKSGQDLGRLSPLGSVPGFDAEKYRGDAKYRESYLAAPISARVFSPAQPGKNIAHLERVSKKRVSLLQGEVALLQVKSIPNMPVTFTSFDLGRFQESQLTTVTVESDDNGIAKASLESPKGTAGDINVLVASPVVTGQVKFLVNVSLPQAVLDHVE